MTPSTELGLKVNWFPPIVDREKYFCFFFINNFPMLIHKRHDTNLNLDLIDVILACEDANS